MSSMTLPIRTVFTLTWTLTDAQGDPINNATVTATLYAGRSLRDPDQFPGTATSPIIGLILTYIPLSAGQYSVSVPATLDPPLDGVGYVLVIDGTVGGNQVYHKEQPVVIETAGSTIDLTTVDAVKDRAQVASGDDDDEIQAAITGFSNYLLLWTGQASLNSITPLDEWYDGNGNQRLFLRSYPIRSVIAVNMNGVSIPVSSGINNWGVIIDQSKKSISLRGGVGNFSTFPYPNVTPYAGLLRYPVFIRALQNVEVQYTAGYPDTPPDLEFAVRCVVAINYKRKGWQDQYSRTVRAGGSDATTRYQSWEMPPEYKCIIENYRRLAVIQ